MGLDRYSRVIWDEHGAQESVVRNHVALLVPKRRAGSRGQDDRKPEERSWYDGEPVRRRPNGAPESSKAARASHPYGGEDCGGPGRGALGGSRAGWGGSLRARRR